MELDPDNPHDMRMPELSSLHLTLSLVKVLLVAVGVLFMNVAEIYDSTDQR